MSSSTPPSEATPETLGVLLDWLSVEERVIAMKATPAWERRAEVALHRKLRKLVAPALTGILQEIKALGVVPSPRTAKLMAAPLKDLAPDYSAIVEAAAVLAAGHGRRRTIAECRRAGQPVRVRRAPKTRDPIVIEPVFTDAVLARIRASAFTASAQTMAAITGDVMAAIGEAYAAGLGIDEAAAHIASSFDGLLGFQLRRIARTEINGASNLGSFETLRTLHVELHQWLTASDDRVRAEHVSLDGQVVKVGQRFTNGLRYPGDRSGDIGSWINCRCRPVPYIPPEGEPVPRTPFHA